MTAALRILLVENDELFRLGLRTKLEQQPDIEVVAEATDGEMAVWLTNHSQPDVVILDVNIPGIGGVEACRQIKQQHRKLPILVLTSLFQKSLITRLIDVGVQGFCLKGLKVKVLLLAVRSLAAGASWWDQVGTAQIREVFQTYHSNSTATETTKQPENEQSNSTETEKATQPEPLTKREQEVLALLALGKTNQEIAEIMYITPGTVRVHVHGILKKLEVRDRTQAALVAIQKQLVDVTLLSKD
ncbi:MAG: response regulator transcription factor [Gloeocapsa sp. UFS-A4-WI-NPMV-4B04]|jgi:two-component system NarL family response regulator|nr:response regulator transcription factor [Gloeocapsa sp. UFS-A4-WI-NPMV-4B04]